MKVQYIAFDRTVFETEEACEEYELKNISKMTVAERLQLPGIEQNEAANGTAPIDDEALSDFADYYWVRATTEEGARILEDIIGEEVRPGEDWFCIKDWDGDITVFDLCGSMNCVTEFFKLFSYDVEITKSK